MLQSDWLLCLQSDLVVILFLTCVYVSHLRRKRVLLVLDMYLSAAEVLIDEEELFPDDALSTHTDMVDNEPAVNEARRQFMR